MQTRQIHLSLFLVYVEKARGIIKRDGENIIKKDSKSKKTFVSALD
jgi:hypothetical protein